MRLLKLYYGGERIMKAATASEMRGIDHRAINEYGIPGVVLMENAGVAVVKEIEKVIGSLTDKKICIFAGKGNNGGDGYVIARHLFNRGAKGKVFLLGDKTAIAGDARVNLDILDKMGIDVLEVVSDRDWDKVKIASTFADFLVDALLGTGFQGELSDVMAQAVDIINRAGKTVFSVDIPSGVNADNGQIGNLAVKADYTVTFGLPKPGMLLYPGALLAGEVIVADIGIPAGLQTNPDLKQTVVEADTIRALFRPRRPDAHKGSCGKVLVVAGSQGLTGAAALTSTSALRTGAGLVTLAIAESLHDIMEVKLTEVMTSPLPELHKGAIGQEALPRIAELAANCEVLAVGPGLGRQDDTMIAICEMVKTFPLPMVIDADGLNALVGNTDLLTEVETPLILTPHPGEMARLTGLTADEVNRDRIGTARSAAAAWGCIVVLKGARTVTALPDGNVFINTSGNSGMASGGTGDVLTGVIAGLLAQGLSAADAAVAGVYIHGLAGDLAADKGTIGLMAGDVLNFVPRAIADIHRGK